MGSSPRPRLGVKWKTPTVAPSQSMHSQVEINLKSVEDPRLRFGQSTLRVSSNTKAERELLQTSLKNDSDALGDEMREEENPKKALNRIHSQDKGFEHRTSLPRLLEVHAALTNEQRAAINSMGFRAMTRLRIRSLDKCLLPWIINCFDVETKKLSIHGKELIITPDVVNQALGIPHVGKPLLAPVGSQDGYELYGSIFEQRGKVIDVEQLVNHIKNSRGTGMVFKVQYLMVLFSTVLAPNSSGTFNLEDLELLVDIEEIRSYNFAQLVIERLCDGVRKYKENDQTYISGCILLLELVFLSMLCGTIPEIQQKLIRQQTYIEQWSSQDVADIMKVFRAKGGPSNPKIWENTHFIPFGTQENSLKNDDTHLKGCSSTGQMKLFVTSASTSQQIESQSNSIFCHQDINNEHLKKVEIDHQSYQARLNLFLTEQLSTLNKRVTSIEGHVVNLMCRNVGYGENDNLDISKDQLMQLSCVVSELHTIVANLPQMIPNVVEDKLRCLHGQWESWDSGMTLTCIMQHGQASNSNIRSPCHSKRTGACSKLLSEEESILARRCLAVKMYCFKENRVPKGMKVDGLIQYKTCEHFLTNLDTAGLTAEDVCNQFMSLINADKAISEGMKPKLHLMTSKYPRKEYIVVENDLTTVIGPYIDMDKRRLCFKFTFEMPDEDDKNALGCPSR